MTERGDLLSMAVWVERLRETAHAGDLAEVDSIAAMLTQLLIGKDALSAADSAEFAARKAHFAALRDLDRAQRDLRRARAMPQEEGG